MTRAREPHVTPSRLTPWRRARPVAVAIALGLLGAGCIEAKPFEASDPASDTPVPTDAPDVALSDTPDAPPTDTPDAPPTDTADVASSDTADAPPPDVAPPDVEAGETLCDLLGAAQRCCLGEHTAFCLNGQTVVEHCPTGVPCGLYADEGGLYCGGDPEPPAVPPLQCAALADDFCVPACDGASCGGDDGCGGTCGCSHGTSCEQGECVLVDFCMTDISLAGCCIGAVVYWCNASGLVQYDCTKDTGAPLCRWVGDNGPDCTSDGSLPAFPCPSGWEPL